MNCIILLYTLQLRCIGMSIAQHTAFEVCFVHIRIKCLLKSLNLGLFSNSVKTFLCIKFLYKSYILLFITNSMIFCYLLILLRNVEDHSCYQKNKHPIYELRANSFSHVMKILWFELTFDLKITNAWSDCDKGYLLPSQCETRVWTVMKYSPLI